MTALEPGISTGQSALSGEPATPLSRNVSIHDDATMSFNDMRKYRPDAGTMRGIIRTALIPATWLLLAAAARAETPIGLWETGESHIEIYNCGDLLCGRIAELDEPLDAEGKPKTDENNPDPALRTRPILGMDLIAGFSRKSDTQWVKGRIYDPRDGKTYKCKMSLQKDGTLEVRGYVGLSLFGKTVVWTRIE